MSTNRFHVLNVFVGFGNPKGQIWFAGLEEASKWNADPSADEAMYSLYEKQYFPIKPGQIEAESKSYGLRYTKIYDIMSKFVISIKNQSLLGWREYRNKRLFTRDVNTFQMNLYPLGKKSISEWPPYYKNLFGFGTSDRQLYYEAVIETRLPLLRNEWKKYAPNITVCFGKAGWEDFERVCGPFGDYSQIGDCRIYANGVVLCPFFNPRYMPDKQIIELATHLREILPNLKI